MTDLEKKVSIQIAECNAKWKNLEKCMQGCKDDTKEILDILRGEGTDAGLVGMVQAHEARLNGISRTFKMIWGSLAGIITAIIGAFVKSNK